MIIRIDGRDQLKKLALPCFKPACSDLDVVAKQKGAREETCRLPR